MFTRLPITKFDQRYYVTSKEHVCHFKNILTTKKGHMTQNFCCYLISLVSTETPSVKTV